jgi:hypothetical protein
LVSSFLIIAITCIKGAVVAFSDAHNHPVRPLPPSRCFFTRIRHAKYASAANPNAARTTLSQITVFSPIRVALDALIPTFFATRIVAKREIVSRSPASRS